MLRGLLKTAQTNISPYNPILALPRPQKIAKNAKNAYKKGRKVDFLTLGHGGLRGSGPYYSMI